MERTQSKDKARRVKLLKPFIRVTTHKEEAGKRTAKSINTERGYKYLSVSASLRPVSPLVMILQGLLSDVKAVSLNFLEVLQSNSLETQKTSGASANDILLW